MDDVELEANWYDEFGAALESVAAEYHRAARLLRVAGRALRSDQLDGVREQLARLTARTIRAADVTTALAPSSVKERKDNDH